MAEGSPPKCCILDIDVQGADAVRKASLPASFVFLAPPTMAELERRLRSRGTESESDVQKRLNGAAAEMARRDEPGMYTPQLSGTGGEPSGAQQHWRAHLCFPLIDPVSKGEPVSFSPPFFLTKVPLFVKLTPRKSFGRTFRLRLHKR